MRTWCLVLALSLFMTACKGDKDATPAGATAATKPDDGPIETCKLVTKADVEPILGGSIGVGERGNTSEYCRFVVKGPLKSGEKSSLGDEGGYLDVNWNEHWTTVPAATKLGMMPVTTVGVDAWYNQYGTALEVSYRGGSLEIQLTTFIDTPDNAGKALPALTAIAKVALAHH